MQGSRRRSGKRLVVVFAASFVLIVSIAGAPLWSALIAGWIADAHGCVLNEGGVHPCVIGGADRGELLLTMFVVGYFGMVTVPAGMVALAIWAVAALLVAVLRRRGERQA